MCRAARSLGIRSHAGTGSGALSCTLSLVVHATDVAIDKTGAHERHRDTAGGQLVMDGLGESAHGELAHAVGRRRGRGHVPGHAADDHELTPCLPQLGKRGVQRAEDAEDVRLQLPAKVVER